ncbi:hypothetical protein [Acinetobacter thutiue]|uniref:hypothetical protein n=1 Tax=Acinetobacter thutiue TaxID=2998078 RepID=UPI0033900493
MSCVIKSVVEIPVSVKLLNDNVPATGGVLSTVTVEDRVSALFPATSVTTALNW